MRLLKSKTVTWLLAALSLALGTMFGYGGPSHTEALIVPIAGPTKGKIISETLSELCWYIEFQKKRDATPVFFSWVLTLPNGDRYYLAPYRPDRRGYSNNTTTKMGETGRYYNCARKPDGMSSIGDIATLSAYGEYQVWHGLWTVPRYVAPFSERDFEHGKKEDQSR